MTPPQLRISGIAAVAALALGAGLHWLAVYLRDYGPSGAAWSLRGNGATVVLPLALLGLLTVEVLCAQRHAWLGLLLAPPAVFAGLFIVFGSF